MPRDRARIEDMLDAGREVSSLLADQTEETFLANRLLTLSTERLLEILGEATSRISVELQQARPEIPWRSIVGMRNILAHDYGKVDPRRLWQTVRQDLPGLLVQLEGILAELNKNGENP